MEITPKVGGLSGARSIETGGGSSQRVKRVTPVQESWDTSLEEEERKGGMGGGGGGNARDGG